MIISCAAAMSTNRVIGVKNRLPWHLPADLAYFKSLTAGHPVIMGSKTYQALPPNQRPLPDRTNIVLTRDPKKQFKEAITVTSLAQAIKQAEPASGGQEIFIIGGAQIFQLALPLVHRIYLTVVETEITDGDAYFPELDPVRWQEDEIGRFKIDDRHQFNGRFLILKRTNQYPIVEPSNGRSPKYRSELQEILTTGVCPFCPQGKTINTQAVLRKTDYWYATPNAYPLKNSLFHFMITPWRHITNVNDISTAEWQDFVQLRRWLTNQYNLTGDALYVRSGEPLVTGASVAHLHWQIIVPASQIEVNFGQFPTK